MTEAELEENVRQMCKTLGVLRFHVRDSRGMAKGFPDDLLVGRRGILWRELKVAGRRLTPEQRQVGYLLTSLGQNWAVWRERDWPQRIQWELEAIR